MHQKTDLIYDEVIEHPTRWCSCGHLASELFKRDGVNATKTRFFHVQGLGIDGIYCEPCLIVANYVAKKKV